MTHVLSEAFLVSAELPSDADVVEFRVTVDQMPAELLGTKLRLRLGRLTIMTLDFPPKLTGVPLRFGPTRLDLARLKHQREFKVVFSSENNDPFFQIPDKKFSGEFFEALMLDTSDDFFTKIQLYHSRYKNPNLLFLGALSAYVRFTDFAVRASALTILAHRLLEQDFKTFDEQDWKLMRWLCDEGLLVVKEGADSLTDTNSLAWNRVRWTVSLATVCGLLSICQDRLQDAKLLFGLAAAQTDHVRVAPVSALNLANACLFHGLLLAMDGEMKLARDTLECGITAYPKCVAAQNIMANIWVIGDLINVARTSRMCFIALGRLGLLHAKPAPQMSEAHIFDLRQVQSPLATILEKGLSPRLAASVQNIAERTLKPGIAI